MKVCLCCSRTYIRGKEVRFNGSPRNAIEICGSCFKNPDTIDFANLEANLKARRWDPADIDAARAALRKLFSPPKLHAVSPAG